MGKPLKILILTQYYVPESGAPQNRWHDLAMRLTGMGHKVTVLTAMPNYPVGKVFEGYRGKIYCRDSDGPVPVLRTWIYATPSKSLGRRMLNYLSFAATALVWGAFHLRPQDLVIWESPPLFCGPFARLLAWLKGAKCVMNVSDLWPESAVALKLVSPDGWATRMSEKLEMWLYRHSHAVTGQTQGIVDSIARRVPGLPVSLFPNGVDLAMFKPDVPDEALRQELGMAGKFVLGYGGIIGHAQALEQVLQAAERLRNRKDVLFTFFGDGPVKNALMKQADSMGLDNVRFYPRQDRGRMPKIIGLWDVGLVPLAAHKLFDGARPSKMFELMGQAKPVLFCGQGEGAQIIADRQCGVVTPPEDPPALAKAVEGLLENRHQLEKMGRNGRKAAEEDFDRNAIARRMSQLLQKVCASARR
jgi:glycosyltransferase involved in cell wall biosynthesis